MLNETEIRRVFRIIETTRHAERNRLAFVLSIYSGLRVGEIAALTIADVATQICHVRREIKLGAHQTKGAKGRTVVLSERVRKELSSFLKSHPSGRGDPPLIASQRNGRAFNNVSLSNGMDGVFMFSAEGPTVMAWPKESRTGAGGKISEMAHGLAARNRYWRQGLSCEMANAVV